MLLACARFGSVWKPKGTLAKPTWWVAASRSYFPLEFGSNVPQSRLTCPPAQIAYDLMDEVVSLASDYIGNTIVQKVSKPSHVLSYRS